MRWWLLLLGLGTSQGAVLDLLNLVHKYEDDILGRRVGLPGGRDVREERNDSPNLADVGMCYHMLLNNMMQKLSILGHPVEVHGWDDNLKLGQVSAVDVNADDDPVVFQRGPVVWDAESFGFDNVLKKRVLIEEDTILVVDADKGKVKSSFGAGLFYMPHGLTIDQEGNTWVSDVGLHQVMRFSKGETKPSLGMML